MTGCQAINNIFFPEICSSCGEIGESFLCQKCRRKIAQIKNISCSFCGAPFTSDIGKPSLNCESTVLLPPSAGCPACRDFSYNFYKLRSFGLYKGVLKKLIIKFKYSKIWTLAPVLNSFLKKAYMENYISEKIDYMDTVPDFNDLKSSAAGFSGREDNHMQILARMFSKETGIPYGGNIIKIKKTLKQQNLGLYERKVNLEGVFKTADSLKADNKNILLIDDVLTTGNTLNEISRALKNCGAKKIYLLTIARAV